MNPGASLVDETSTGDELVLATNDGSNVHVLPRLNPIDAIENDERVSKDTPRINGPSSGQTEKDIEANISAAYKTSSTERPPFDKDTNHDLEKQCFPAYSDRCVPEREGSLDLEKTHVLTSSDTSADRDGEDDAAAAVESQQDPDIVDWDGPNDPENPMNWPAARRWGMIAVVSGITFLTPLGSSMFAPGVPLVMQDFHSSNELLAGFVVSVYVLGFACGPLVIAPLSEMWGRNPLYHSCNILFVIFNIACAVSSNLNMLIGFRFLTGCVGSAPLTLGGGTIGDVTNREQRGTAMAAWIMGPTIGPVVGPIAGGFLSQAVGWRWTFWVLSIASGIMTVATILLLKETSAIAILATKTRRLRASTGNRSLRSRLDSGLSARDLFLRSIVRPTKLLVFSPIVLLISVYVAVVYAYLYLLFTTFTPVYREQYGFSLGTAGLAYLGIGVGCFVGQFINTRGGNAIVRKHIARGDLTPEHRLPVMVPGAVMIPIGLFWYGWSVQAKVHWIVPIIATSFVGAGLLMTFMPASTYLVDVFTIYAASAMAANTVLRSVVAAILPLAGEKMYAELGLGWGNSLLGFIALALMPTPLFFMRYGERIRTRYPVKL